MPTGQRCSPAGSTRSPAAIESGVGGGVDRGPPPGNRRGCYQITTFFPPLLTIASPSLQPKALLKASILEGVALARTPSGECGSEAMIILVSSGVYFSRQAEAKPRKK